MIMDQQPMVIINTPALIPTKRPFEDDHTPTVSSPLNPDAAPRPKPRTIPAKEREQREKKDSLKKREAVGANGDHTPGQANKKRKGFLPVSRSGLPSPIRYNHALPQEAFRYENKEPVFASHEPEPIFAPDSVELKKPVDHTENRKMYRYNHCIADPSFTHLGYYRQSDAKPFGPRMSFEDSDKCFSFDESGTRISNERGWRMGRANVCAREGRFYFEVKILRGVAPDGPAVPDGVNNPLPHIRMGWARREAPLDAPVGFDGYSYGLTDIRMEPMHKSRASKFLDSGIESSGKKAKPKSLKLKQVQPSTSAFAANDNAREGDVIGLEITLPSISLHRKVVDGVYNPLVDVGSGLDHPTIAETEEGAPNIVRDRFPVAYKGAMYFESFEYRASKGMEGYGDRGPFAKETPSTNHADPTLRCLPHSSIKVYKNGKMVGTAFRNLMAFLPPASAPLGEKGARQGFDDGMLGYFPAVSAFSGGVAQVNLGPHFWCPPPDLLGSGARDMTNGQVTHGTASTAGSGINVTETGNETVVKQEDTTMEDGVAAPAPAPAPALRSQLRGIGERYTEQIAEDVWYDLIDECDFFIQDGAMVDGE